MLKRLLLISLCLFFSLFLKAQISDANLKERVAYLSLQSLGDEEITNYLYDYLQNIGLLMLTDRNGDDFMMHNNNGDTISSKNIVGIIPGYDPILKSEYILLGAHYDRITPPAANHNASGVAALCEVAKIISENKFIFRRSVIIAFFGAGELGNAGSWYFVNRSFPEPDKIRFMLDFNSLGRAGEDFPFQVFAGVPTSSQRILVEEVNNRPFSLQGKLIENAPFSSDYINFYEKEIPILLLTTGTTTLKGSANDTPDLLDYFQMKQIVEWSYSFSMLVANQGVSDAPNELEETSLSGDKIYSQFEVEKRATYMKSDERTFLRDWVYKYISYPQSALDAGVTGDVECEFVVNKKGEIRDVTVVKSVSPALDNEVVKVIKASPKWKPASVGGKNVDVRIRVVVEFRATKDGKVGIKW